MACCHWDFLAIITPSPVYQHLYSCTLAECDVESAPCRLNVHALTAQPDTHTQFGMSGFLRLAFLSRPFLSHPIQVVVKPPAAVS